MTNDPQWTPCQTGTIQQLAESDTAPGPQIPRRMFFAGGIAAVTAGVSWLVMQQQAAQPLTCLQAMALAKDYLADQLGWIQRSRMDSHLSHCSACRRRLETLRQAEQQA